MPTALKLLFTEYQPCQKLVFSQTSLFVLFEVNTIIKSKYPGILDKMTTEQNLNCYSRYVCFFFFFNISFQIELELAFLIAFSYGTDILTGKKTQTKHGCRKQK